MDVSPSVNIIYGENAQGKTNLVEAIWLFTGGKSFRGAKDAELVSLGKEKATLLLSYFAQERNQEAQIQIENGRRTFLWNGIPKRGASEVVGSFCSVIFSPEHLTLVKNGPAARRAFLDAAICQIKPSYSALLSRYTRTLTQRNALLKDIPRHSELLDTLIVWDERLAGYGERLVEERLAYCKLLESAVLKVYRGISREKETIQLSYQSSFRETLAQALQDARREDVACGHTSVGPHRDDLTLLLDGLSARTFASQGQQRSIVLALKLAEAEILFLKTGEQPVVLLDDVLSELDAKRQDYLLNHLGDRQIFLTCCESGPPQQVRNGMRFFVENGKVTRA